MISKWSNTQILIGLLFVGLGSACGDPETKQADPDVDMGTRADVDMGGSADSGDPGVCEASDTPFDVEMSEIDGSVLELQVTYGGGCAAHDFAVGWSGIASTSNPPKVPLEFHHYANGDTCEGIETSTLFIDLSTLHGLGDEMVLQILSSESETVADINYKVGVVSSPLPDGVLTIDPECSFLQP